MNYSIKASSASGNDAVLKVKKSTIGFGTTEPTAEELPNPAELFLGSFAACILKNIERFSKLLHYNFRRSVRPEWTMCIIMRFVKAPVCRTGHIETKLFYPAFWANPITHLPFSRLASRFLSRFTSSGNCCLKCF